MSPHISLMPHAVCWAASPGLIWTMVVTNLITFLSYFSISLTLLFLARKTGSVIAKDWIWFLVGFALFIVACGSTHLMEVVTTWSPVFWVDAGTNVVTALLSGYVAIMLIRRAATISFGINDYAGRLAGAEDEKHRLEESLLAASKLEDWSRMSAAMAHEISNPLETVQNLLYLIRGDDAATPELARLAEAAEAEAQRVMTISRSMLGFFRHSAVPERVDLRAAGQSVSYLLETVARERRLTIDVQAFGDTTVEALAGEARQVLLNLIRNACEATGPAGDKVEVRLEGQPKAVLIEVIDHGSGIAPELLPNLFHFGFSSKGEKGNGIGLWTVSKIVRRHGGEVTVESVEGLGTTFRVRWPRQFPAGSSPEVPWLDRSVPVR